MFVDFEVMPGDSRIWIYQSNRALSESEVVSIENECKAFLTQWTAHGAGLKSSAIVMYSRFVILCVDEKEAEASGCSIDSSVHFIQSLGNALKIDFFNRTLIAFLIDNEVNTERLSDVKNGLTQSAIKGDTLTFNNLIQNKSQLENNWIIPVSDSWLGRYFKTQNV
jgi:hypothetical protein